MRILLLTARDSIEDRVHGLDAGADDYLVKPFAFEELLARIRVMLRKPASVKTNIYRVADLEVHVDTCQVFRGGKEISLSGKEFSLSSQELLAGVQIRLEQEVAGARDDIEFRNGKLKFDSDLLDLDYGVYLSVYSSDGTLIYGKIPYDFDNSFPFVDGEIRRIQGKDSEFFLMDMVFEITDYGVVDVRGITSITEAESSFSMTLRLAVILLPFLVMVTAVLGYFMAGKTLRPVKVMTDTG